MKDRTQRFKVLFPIETTSREFEGRINIAKELASRGDIDVIVCSRSWAYDYLLMNRVHFILFKSLDIDSINVYKSYRRRGIILGLLHAEGGIFYKDLSASLKSIYHDDFAKILSINFVWGDRILQEMQNLGLKLSRLSVVSGEPRFAISHSQRSIKDTKFSVVLFNSSFSICNPIIGREELLNYWDKSSSINFGAKKALKEKRVIFDNVFKLYLELLEEILERTSFSLIVRPHPSENTHLYEKLLMGYPNRVIITKMPLNEVLDSVDIVLHYDCTTAIESFLSGKHVISYQPIADNPYAAWLPIAISNTFSSKDDLISSLSNIESLSNRNVNRTMLEEYLGPLDSRVYTIISDSIFSLLRQKRNFKSRGFYFPPLYAILKRRLVLLRASIFNHSAQDMENNKFVKLQCMDLSKYLSNGLELKIIDDYAIRIRKI